VLRVLALTACLTLLFAAPAAAQSADAGLPAGPLTHITVGNNLSCQAQQSGDSSPEFAPGACGTMLATGGAVWGPMYTGFTPVTQNHVPGGVSTTVDAGTTGLRVVQNDSYNAGQDAWRTDITVTNSGPATRSVVLYRVGDCFLQSTGSGYGFLDAVNGGGGCAAQPNNTPADRVIAFTPISPAASFRHADRSVLFANVAAMTPLSGTCDNCTTRSDDAAGLSWSFDVVPGESITRSLWTVLSPVGRTGAPAPVAAPPPVPPTTTTVTGTQINFTPPKACVRAGLKYKLRVTSIRKKRISKDRFGYIRRVRILRVDFSVDKARRLTDKKAAFKAVLPSRGLAPGEHPLAARVTLQPLKTRGRQVLTGKKFTRTLASAVNVCPPA
jgi:hypothetical protein